MSKSIQSKLDVWQNINQWESFTKQKRFKQKELLNEVVEKNSQNIQHKISELIQEKLSILLHKGLSINHFDNYKKGYRLTNYNDQMTYEE